ncbi:hypothetical protein SAMN05216266_104315 [Amycolatopsis marina]|uniref:Uncharacterized protein n=1 Tax=Amycolatopsis marina TaxID=490629 RepID=A0A1I0Y9Y0_9PSEU|nr:hypothetical protein SAMN05216266_104315 [Amycolatopsis marina]
MRLTSACSLDQAGGRSVPLLGQVITLSGRRGKIQHNERHSVGLAVTELWVYVQHPSSRASSYS